MEELGYQGTSSLLGLQWVDFPAAEELLRKARVVEGGGGGSLHISRKCHLRESTLDRTEMVQHTRSPTYLDRVQGVTAHQGGQGTEKRA